MKISFCIFLLVFLSLDKCFSQDSTTHVFHLDKLPLEGALLDKDWKFHPGDNSKWARQEFDDRNWQVLNLNQPIAHLPQFTKNNIVWLRLRFIVSDSAKDKFLALLINQYGASELYVDGNLLQTFGKVGILKEDIYFNPHNEPVAFQLNMELVHVIAVRFAFDKSFL
jgi:hypothetical protein